MRSIFPRLTRQCCGFRVERWYRPLGRSPFGSSVDTLKSQIPAERDWGAINRDFGKWPTRKSLGGEYEGSGGHYFLSLPVCSSTHAGCTSADHPTCFSFLETSCSFSRRPVHQSPLASRDVLPTGPPKKAVYSLTGNASSPFRAEPAHISQTSRCGWRIRLPSASRPLFTRSHWR